MYVCIYVCMYVCIGHRLYLYLLYFKLKYDFFGLANISRTSAIKLIFAFKIGKSKNLEFSNFEGFNKIT